MTTLSENLTPMLRQYLEIKQRHQDAFLFFRLGDFYEMFFEDAVKASELLNIALTSRNKNAETQVPLCGVPYHSASAYIRKLIEKGYKVAICEQTEDPKNVKGIVKREVTRVVTPGLLVEDESLSSHEPNYLATIRLQDEASVALLDISTGEVLVGFYESPELALEALVKQRIKELVVDARASEAFVKKIKAAMPGLLVTLLEDRGEEVPKELFSEAFLRSCEELESHSLSSLLGPMFAYVARTQRSLLHHLGPVQILRERQFLGIDSRTLQHLELLQSQPSEGKGKSLFSVLNKTQTSMGARRLKKWIHYPLMDLDLISRRQDAIAELLDHPQALYDLQERLKNIQDVERMLGKIALATVNARDLYQLASSLKHAQAWVVEAKGLLQSVLSQETLSRYPDLNELYDALLSRLMADLPLSIREGGMIQSGVHAELDELREIRRDGKSFIASLEEKERKRTGINSLKIRYNKVFGYYIEISHAHQDSVPTDYQRKQTLANAERFITPELKQYETKVLGAEERIKTLEHELFCELRDLCSKYLDKLREAADVIGDLDVVLALARAARENRYARPELVLEKVLCLKESRHPVLEQIHSEEAFIPNDIEMREEEASLFLITGPNMAGKSTIMRQVALNILMAQMGSFVPAKEAKIGLVDQVFTRIGASDDLSKGQSTFMVEMLETANILRKATERSFVVLDEIGRGTSTYDGMSIAWAVAEHIAKGIRCRALFATHYHELTEMSETHPEIANYQVAVKEWNDQILFLRKLVRGGASRSYGIEVARLAGLPEGLLKRAREILKGFETMEGKALASVSRPSTPPAQLALFQNPYEELISELKSLAPEAMTPLQALDFLFKLKDRL